MTICIGFNLGEYVLLASDTRTIFFDGSYEDDYQKVVKTSFGLITGAGYTDLLDEAKEDLATLEEGFYVGGLSGFFKEKRERHLEEVPQGDEFLRKLIVGTSWLLSYWGEREDQKNLRLAVVSYPSFGDEIALCVENSAIVVMPHESNQEESEKINEILNEKLKSLREKESLEDNIKYHVGISGQAIHDVSEIHERILRTSM